MDDDIDDLLSAGGGGSARRAKFRQSAHFTFNELESIDHGIGRPTSLGAGFSIQTNGGDKLMLGDLVQYHTHAGQLAGFPLDDEDKIVDAISYARKQFPGHDAAPFVVPPVLHRGRARRVIEGFEHFEDWCVLPSVTSFGMFTSSRAASDSDDPYSSVLVIWYQEKFGLPDHPGTLQSIAGFDWERHAHSWNW